MCVWLLTWVSVSQTSHITTRAYACVHACHYVHICVSLVGTSHKAYNSRPHPFLISVWSIAGCCDAVRGEPCQSRGTVTFQQPGITVDLIVVIRIQPQHPLRWPHLVHTAPGCWRLFKTHSSPRPSPSLSSAVHLSNLHCKHISLLMFFCLFFFNFLNLFLFSKSIAASCF